MLRNVAAKIETDVVFRDATSHLESFIISGESEGAVKG
jgi:hypothetical protein